ncbi:Hydrazine synthase subunit beta [Usitatibacter rugosus]|uniref:Hydrazine synthase subunit beta n=1 Tax=Usitatibacter rugosus TaxID=2732067 RepID=A0A6M4H2A1_9PROT|nr:YncE family protein [Usitatibacter rugosus]QJR11967.1 Hydrazine synthase subunit beta [Usitatibacter rugosus]
MKTALLAATLALAATAHADTLVVLNKAESTLVTVDPATMKVLGRVATGRGPHEAVASADGKLAYVANYGDQSPNNSLSIIDLATLKEVKRVDLGALVRPHGLAEHGGKIYFTSETSRTVARYDPATDKVDWIAGTGQSTTHMLALSPDGKKIYTANIQSDSVTVLTIGPPTPAAIVQVAVGKSPEAIDASPDGREVWVGQNGDGRISIIDTATNTVKDSFKVGELPIRLKFTPDGKRVLVADPKNDALVVVDVATRREVKRIAIDGVPLGIQMAPDGKRAYVSRAQAGKVDAIDLEKLEVVGSVETGKGPDGLAYAR